MFRFMVIDRIDRKLLEIFDDLESARKFIDKINNKSFKIMKSKRIIALKIRSRS